MESQPATDIRASSSSWISFWLDDAGLWMLVSAGSNRS
jgi:hypothetical protein